MKKSSKIIGATVLVLAVSTSVFAFGEHKSWRMSPADKIDYIKNKMANKLELTDIQKINLSTLADEIIEVSTDIKTHKKNHKQTVLTLLSEPTLDQAKVLESIRQKTTAINERAPQLVASIAGFLDSLDLQQKEQLAAFVEHKMSHSHKRH